MTARTSSRRRKNEDSGSGSSSARGRQILHRLQQRGRRRQRAGGDLPLVGRRRRGGRIPGRRRGHPRDRDVADGVLEIDVGHAAVGIVGHLLPGDEPDPGQDPPQKVGIDRPVQLVQALGDLGEVHRRQRPLAAALVPGLRPEDEIAQHGAGRIGARPVELGHAVVAHRLEQAAALRRQRGFVGQDQSPAVESAAGEGQDDLLRHRLRPDRKAHHLFVRRFGLGRDVDEPQRGHVEDVEHQRAPARLVPRRRRRTGVHHEPRHPAQRASVALVGRGVRRRQQTAQGLARRGVAEHQMTTLDLAVVAETVPVLAVVEAPGEHLAVLRQREDDGARGAGLLPRGVEDVAVDDAFDDAVVGLIAAGDAVTVLLEAQDGAAGAPEGLPFAREIRRLGAHRGRRQREEQCTKRDKGDQKRLEIRAIAAQRKSGIVGFAKHNGVYVAFLAVGGPRRWTMALCKPSPDVQRDRVPKMGTGRRTAWRTR